MGRKASPDEAKIDTDTLFAKLQPNSSFSLMPCATIALLAIPLLLEQIFTVDSDTTQICPFHEVQNLRQGPDDAFGPEIG